MKIPLKTCPRMGCGHRMVRAYIRAPLTGKFIPHHWVCPECGMTLADPITAARNPA